MWQILGKRRNAKSYIATADVLDEFRVDFGLLDDLLEQGVDEVIELSIFKSTLEALGKWCTDSESNHYIVGILRCTVIGVRHLLE